MKLAKRIYLADIEKMERGSVVWHELHCHDNEANIDFHSIIPMMVGASGKNGVLCWADQASQLIYDLNESFESRIFWDNEPDESQITFGISEKEYNAI